MVRLGHVVLNVSNFRASEAWYKDRFGLITSDEIAVDPDVSAGRVPALRPGRDAHRPPHTLPDAGPQWAGFQPRAAFEVAVHSDLMAGHEQLKAAGSDWQVGRRPAIAEGSQVFDYWRDPWGHTLEHWTDGDLFTAADGSNVASVRDLLGVQWGAQMPPTMG